ncbi:MAG: S9 family peptidase [Planctomycetes bacterium]|nr:S9 family peptidase [Planctomycetota bacterium]
MRSHCQVTILSALLLLSAHVAAQKQKLTFEQTLPGPRGVNFNGSLPTIAWAADGVHVVLREDGKALWLDPVTLATSDAPAETAPASQPGRANRTARADLPKDGKPRREAAASPDGKWVAFELENNLVVRDSASGKEWEVTTDGSPLLLHGRLDWVYQEEVYGRGKFRAFWWSPDSARIAFLSLDQTGVKDFAVVDHLPAALDKDKTVRVLTEKYPKAGDPNPKARLTVADLAGQATVPMDLSGYDSEVLLVRVGWAPDGKRVLVQVQDRIQTWLDLVAVDAATGKVTRLFRETSPTWVNVLEEPRWLADGTFLWLSERTGFKHVYHYAADGSLLKQVTEGEWAVDEILRVDEQARLLWFTGTRDGAANQNAYRVKLDGSGLTRLTQGDGWHQVTLNGNGTFFLDRWSAAGTPPAVRLCKDDGSVVKVLAETKVAALDRYEYSPKEMLKIPARDGVELDAALIKPAGFDPGRKYPIWFETYAGPGAPSVANRWSGDAWSQFLAQQGYLVFQVDNRTASRRGHKHVGELYKNFGASELRDIEDALEWLCRNPWADATRVGMHGWSYGGFITAYCLVNSKRFKLGIAGAGVYDWRLYDTIYTERYMSTPELNREGYQSSSVVARAKNLHGQLVLIHGTMDDNVHLQNAMRFVYELQKAGKLFDMMFYPKMMHGPSSLEQYQHVRTYLWHCIQKYL